MPDLIDVRQREAALLLLTGIDLPAEMGAYARHMIAAAKVLPGATMHQVAGSRRDGLRRAQDLIAAMLAEATTASSVGTQSPLGDGVNPTPSQQQEPGQ